MALCAILVASFFYAPLLVPSNRQLAAAEPELRIATYNIWNHNIDLQAVVEQINALNVDVIAVQELTDVQQASFIEQMSATYPHYYISEQVYGGTTGLFSKLPLSNVQALNFNIDRPAILADVMVDAMVVTVVSAHLNPSYWAYHDKPLLEIPGNYHQYIKDQNAQARMIIDAVQVRENSHAIVLACDCNSQETASTNRLLRSYFKESFRSVGFQLGQPDEAALQYERKLNHIDYIWFTGSINPTAVYRARESAGSDHAPVVADFVAVH